MISHQPQFVSDDLMVPFHQKSPFENWLFCGDKKRGFARTGLQDEGSPCRKRLRGFMVCNGNLRSESFIGFHQASTELLATIAAESGSGIGIINVCRTPTNNIFRPQLDHANYPVRGVCYLSFFGSITDLVTFQQFKGANPIHVDGSLRVFDLRSL
jgi:hypothetical protein